MKSAKKKPRSYDSRSRLVRADQTRAAVLDVALRRFQKRGYAATTVAEVAAEAGVSVETVYKSYGGKPGLMRALLQRALAGQGARPAPARSDELSARAETGRAVVRGWGALTAEVSPLVSPIMLLARSAAGSDASLARLIAQTERERLERMRDNAKKLAKRGFMRRGVSVERAAQILWAHSSPELYELFVIKLGWTAAQLGEYVGEALEALLL